MSASDKAISKEKKGLALTLGKGPWLFFTYETLPLTKHVIGGLILKINKIRKEAIISIKQP